MSSVHQCRMEYELSIDLDINFSYRYYNNYSNHFIQQMHLLFVHQNVVINIHNLSGLFI